MALKNVIPRVTRLLDHLVFLAGSLGPVIHECRLSMHHLAMWCNWGVDGVAANNIATTPVHHFDLTV